MVIFGVSPALNAQRPLRRLGHDPEIKQRLFPLELIDSPQRNVSGLDRAPVSKSNELFVDDVLSERGHRLKREGGGEMDRDRRQKHGLLHLALTVIPHLVLAVLLDIQQLIARRASLQNDNLEGAIQSARGLQQFFGSRAAHEFLNLFRSGRRRRCRRRETVGRVTGVRTVTKVLPDGLGLAVLLMHLMGQSVVERTMAGRVGRTVGIVIHERTSAVVGTVTIFEVQ